jgi:heat shock protein HslJ
MKRLLAMALGGLLGAAPGCAGWAAEAHPPGPPVGGAADRGALVGTGWRLAALGTDPVPADAGITLSFEAGRVTGSGGCNRYFASCVLGANGVLELGPIGSTRRACPEPVMDRERRFFEALQAARSLRLEAGQLVLAPGAEGGEATSLRFERAAPGSP